MVPKKSTTTGITVIAEKSISSTERSVRHPSNGSSHSLFFDMINVFKSFFKTSFSSQYICSKQHRFQLVRKGLEDSKSPERD